MRNQAQTEKEDRTMGKKKYRLGEVDKNGLRRIYAMRTFADVSEGAQGGFVQSEANLSQEGNARVYDDAWIYDNAWVYDNARVYDDARVYDNACVSDNE